MIKDKIIKALEEITGVKNPQLEFPENEAFGDYSSNVAMQIAQKGERGNFLENIEWFWKNVEKYNFSKHYDTSLPVGKLKNSLIYLRGSTFAKIRGFREKFEGHPEITREYFRAFPYVLFNPEHLIRVEKYEARYLLVGHLNKQFAVVVEVDFEKLRGFIVSSFMVKDRYLKSREGNCEKHKKTGKPAGTAIPPILASPKANGGSRFSTLQDTQDFYSKLEAKSQGFSLNYEIKKGSEEWAEEIVKKLNKMEGLPVTAETKAGFINFWLKKDILIDSLAEIDIPKIGKGKTVVIDYSSPNIAKPFGIGHLRSTIIGQALYNLYKSLGYEVIGDNHLGDWGTQFGKLLFMIDKTKTKDFSIENLEKLYVEFHEHPEWEDGGRDWFKRLEEGDKTAREIWQKCIEVSLKEFDRIYRLLGVKIDFAFGESYYQGEMETMMQDPAVKKHVTEGEEGAKVIDLPGMTPLMFLKSDGATTYATRDLATIIFRARKWDPDIIIYEVGAEQTLYFKQLLAAARLMGLVKDNVDIVHTAHGLYLGPNGKKFSTRKGETIKLEEILDEAIKRARKLGNSDESTAKAVGVGAIKYFDLMHSVSSDVVFDWEKIMNMEGNSGPYLQYTTARANSVLRKAKFPISNFQFPMNLQLNNEELSILRKLAQFPEVIITAAKSYSPNILCGYLYDLASKFNTFYNKYRILPDTTREVKSVDTSRVSLTSAVGRVLTTGLALLGIQAPEKM